MPVVNGSLDTVDWSYNYGLHLPVRTNTHIFLPIYHHFFRTRPWGDLDWIVKVDLDTVWSARRLRRQLRRASRRDANFLLNIFNADVNFPKPTWKFYGPIEVFTPAALLRCRPRAWEGPRC